MEMAEPKREFTVGTIPGARAPQLDVISSVRPEPTLRTEPWENLVTEGHVRAARLRLAAPYIVTLGVLVAIIGIYGFITSSWQSSYPPIRQTLQLRLNEFRIPIEDNLSALAANHPTFTMEQMKVLPPVSELPKVVETLKSGLNKDGSYPKELADSITEVDPTDFWQGSWAPGKIVTVNKGDLRAFGAFVTLGTEYYGASVARWIGIFKRVRDGWSAVSINQPGMVYPQFYPVVTPDQIPRSLKTLMGAEYRTRETPGKSNSQTSPSPYPGTTASSDADNPIARMIMGEESHLREAQRNNNSQASLSSPYPETTPSSDSDNLIARLNPLRLIVNLGLLNIGLPALLVMFFLLIIPFTRRIIFKAALFLIGLVPAAILVALALLALPFWKIALWVADHVLRIFPLDRMAERVLTLAGSWSSSTLAKGDRRGFSLERWPEPEFPYLYMTDIPADIERPLYEDGRLVGGYDIAYLADRHFGPHALREAVEAGTAASGLIIVIPLVLAVWAVLAQLGQMLHAAPGSSPLVFEYWPGEPPLSVPLWWWFTAALGAGWHQLVSFVAHGLIFTISAALLLIGVFLLVAIGLLREWQRQKSAPYEVATKDAVVRWPYRAETRKLYQAVYRRQVQQATNRLKGKPTYFVGKATGTLRTRGDLTAPMSGQHVRLDDESLFQHLLILGGTGEGKTTGILKPLMRQIMLDRHFGIYVSDAKGVLWNDAQKIATKVDRADDIVVIGTGPQEHGVNILANLTPTQVAATLRSVLKQMGSNTSESFWPDMAANVLRQILTIAQSYALTDNGAKSIADGLHPYSLWWAYQSVLNEGMLSQAMQSIRDAGAALSQRLSAAKTSEELRSITQARSQLFTAEAVASISYLESTWRDMAKETKSGIVANITQLLDGFSGARVLRERFASGRTDGSITLSAALEGKVILNALSNIEDGLPARLVSIFLKTTLYREARARESRFKAMTPPKSPQDFPCVAFIDEVQEIVTADPESGLSDATFWNVARSTGLAGIFATQTIAALNQALGLEAASNFLQQTRSKIFFRSEDRDTVEYACWCGGEFERGRVYDDGQRESIEYRQLLDRWEPFLPVDPNEGVSGGSKVFLSLARSVLQPEKALILYARPRPAYAPDLRFVSKETVPHTATDMERISFRAHQAGVVQQAVWRAEDLERQYRSQGNEIRPAVTSSDLISMGRWHAYAHIQRAGAVRQDIITIEHDFS